MLVETLRKSKMFQNLPIEEQEVFAKLASVFEQDSQNLFRSPDELSQHTGYGNRHQWSRFLTMEPVINYVNSEIAQLTRVAYRKGIQSTLKSAERGEMQAVKHAAEQVKMLDKIDDNKIVILHHVERPEVSPE